MLGLCAQQRVAVFLRNLVIIGMDFAEGQESVAIAAIFDERRLQRRFDAGNLGQIDIALELLVLGGLEIKLLDAVSLGEDRKSTRLNPVTNAHLVCRLLLEKKKRKV